MTARERTLALVLEYDGSGFHGFAIQDGLPSVAGHVEAALQTLLGHRVKVTAAGRTDAGVHATGQVISCTSTSAMPLRRLLVAANALLRQNGIAVLRVIERENGFSARRDARSRTYRYRILNRIAPSPLCAKRAFHVSATLDVDAMRAAAAYLIGEHDFATFCASESRAQGTTRTIRAIDVERNGDFLDIVITADSFLHNMVRIIAGTLIEVGRARKTADDMRGILASGDRSRAGFTAPPHALYLEQVEYGEPL